MALVRERDSRRLHVKSKLMGERLIAKNLDDLIIERPCLEILQHSEVIDKIQIINGLEHGTITKALKGEHVGTIIHRT